MNKKIILSITGFIFCIFTNLSFAITDKELQRSLYESLAQKNQEREGLKPIARSSSNWPSNQPPSASSEKFSWFDERFNIYLWRDDSNNAWVKIDPIGSQAFICTSSFDIFQNGTFRLDDDGTGIVKLEHPDGTPVCEDVLETSIYKLTIWSFVSDKADITKPFELFYDGGRYEDRESSIRFNTSIIPDDNIRACVSADENLNLNISCANYNNNFYNGIFSLDNDKPYEWRLTSYHEIKTTNNPLCVVLDESLNITIPCISYNKNEYFARLKLNGDAWSIERVADNEQLNLEFFNVQGDAFKHTPFFIRFKETGESIIAITERDENGGDIGRLIAINALSAKGESTLTYIDKYSRPIKTIYPHGLTVFYDYLGGDLNISFFDKNQDIHNLKVDNIDSSFFSDSDISPRSLKEVKDRISRGILKAQVIGACGGASALLWASSRLEGALTVSIRITEELSIEFDNEVAKDIWSNADARISQCFKTGYENLNKLKESAAQVSAQPEHTVDESSSDAAFGGVEIREELEDSNSHYQSIVENSGISKLPELEACIFGSNAETTDCYIENGSGLHKRHCEAASDNPLLGDQGIWGDFGVCELTGCYSGYTQSGSRCVPVDTILCSPDEADSKSCTRDNGVGKQWRHCTNTGQWGEFGSCNLSSCNQGYAMEGVICTKIPDCSIGETSKTTCTVSNGSGEQNRSCSTNGTWGAYGNCEVSSCSSGYEKSGNSCIPVDTILNYPSGITASQGTYPDKVVISWNVVPKATEYVVYYAVVSSTVFYTPLSRTTETKLSITNLPQNTTLYFKVTTLKGEVQSQISPAISGFTGGGQVCKSGDTSTISCSISNGSGEKTRLCTTQGEWGSYGSCTVRSCNSGYIRSGNQCIRDDGASNGATCPESLLSGVWTYKSIPKSDDPNDSYYITVKFFSDGTYLRYVRRYDPTYNNNYNGVYNDDVWGNATTKNNWSCNDKASLKIGDSIAQISTTGGQFAFDNGKTYKHYSSVQTPFGRFVTKSDFPY